MLSISNVLNHIRLKGLGANHNRGDRVRNLSLRRKTTTKLKVISTGDKQNEEKNKTENETNGKRRKNSNEEKKQTKLNTQHKGGVSIYRRGKVSVLLNVVRV